MNAKNKLWALIILSEALLAIYCSLFPTPFQITLSRFLGLAGFLLLCVSLIIGPLAVFSPKRFGKLIPSRKPVGILAFVFVLLHFGVIFALYYGFNWNFIFSSSVIFIGLPALIILLVLTLTSRNSLMCKIGFIKWKWIQRLVYIAFVLSFSHFVYSFNGFFIPLSGGKLFLNLAEVLMLILGLITILLQLAGFVKRIRQKSPEKELLEPSEQIKC